MCVSVCLDVFFFLHAKIGTTACGFVEFIFAFFCAVFCYHSLRIGKSVSILTTPGRMVLQKGMGKA